MLNFFLVGGAVRDKLLGREPKDFDFVVVGATEAELLAAFPTAEKQGAAFPVYRVEGMGEIALARRERPTGTSHTDFEVDFGTEVTLEEDLSRRDLTINAMAINMATSELVDPFGGQDDIKTQTLRHVGPAFADDALRVYRVARFAAQLGFEVHRDTLALMTALAAPETSDPAMGRQLLGLSFTPGESRLVSLSMERVCEETRKALRSRNPREFFEVLADAECLGVHFPELNALREAPAGPQEHHQEGSAFVHTMMCLDEAVKLGASELELAAVLTHDLGKAATDKAIWPKQHRHEELGVPLVKQFGMRLKLPADFIQAGMSACREHLNVHRFMQLRPGSKVDLVMAAGRNPLGVEGLAKVTQADALGRVPSRAGEGPRGLLRAAGLVAGVTAGSLGLPNDTCKGPDVGARLRHARSEVLARELPQP